MLTGLLKRKQIQSSQISRRLGYLVCKFGKQQKNRGGGNKHMHDDHSLYLTRHQRITIHFLPVGQNMLV